MKRKPPKKRESKKRGEARGRTYAATVETSRTMVRSCDVDVVEDDGAAIGNGGDGDGADGAADS